MSILSASVAGRSHRRTHRGSQDSFAHVELDIAGARWAVTAVADGCSGGSRSEVGAGLTARLAVACAQRRLAQGLPLDALPGAAVADVVEELRRIARVLACTNADDPGDGAGVVEDMLLATMQVAVARADGSDAVLFGVGDGVVVVDGRVIVVDQGPAPDYPAYALFPSLAQQPRVLVHHRGPVERHVAVCTDGTVELIAARDHVLADGSVLGGLAPFLEDERYVRNPSLARKRLIAWIESGGGAADDCTVVVLRKASAP